MCGIVGIYNSKRLNTDRGIIRRMSSVISHRGPDEEGFHLDDNVHLGCRRLSIIDLMSGTQPIYNHSKSLCIVFNGEIYNYRQLRDELLHMGYVFKTQTDTEVVLAAYSFWREGCLARFKGMFAFAIWDSGSKELFLARDRFGIKPLYVSDLPDGTFIFASEIKSILCHPEIKRRIYPQAINNMLTCGFNIAPHTFFEGIKQLLPGHFLRISSSNLSIHQYWDIDVDSPEIDADEETIAEMLMEKLSGSVKDCLVADVPVASYLSGGIDSSAVTGLYSNLSGGRIKTISIRFDDAGYDESEYSKSVSERFGTENIEFKCSINEEDICRLILHQENPLVSLLNLPLLLLSAKARENGFKVVLSGDGADEILCGYDYFKLLKAMSFIERSETGCRKNILRKIYSDIDSPESAESLFVYLSNRKQKFPLSNPAIPYQFSEFQLKDQLYSKDFSAFLGSQPMDSPYFFNPEKISGLNLIDQALYLEVKMRLLNLTLPLSDKMSMANSVEVRPVFLDHDLVDFAFRIPHHLKMQGLNEKYILKKSMYRLLPEQICRRKKQPLQPPQKWFIRTAGDVLRDCLSEDKIKKHGYFNPFFVNYMLSEFDRNSQVDFSGIIIVVFFIQLWHDIFLEQKSFF